MQKLVNFDTVQRRIEKNGGPARGTLEFVDELDRRFRESASSPGLYIDLDEDEDEHHSGSSDVSREHEHSVSEHEERRLMDIMEQQANGQEYDLLQGDPKGWDVA